MELELTFPVRQEKHSVRLLKPSGMEVFLDFPVWVSHLNGSTDKVRHDQVEEQKDGTCLANALIRARNGNEYELCRPVASGRKLRDRGTTFFRHSLPSAGSDTGLYGF